MQAIVAVDHAWGIGYKGSLLVHIREDLQFFKSQTMGKVMVMGRLTLESLPGGKPLPGRRNVVLSTQNSTIEGVELCHNIEQLGSVLKGEHALSQAMVIGGGQIYRALLPYCDTILLTRIHAVYPSDITFPNLDMDPNFEKEQILNEYWHQDTKITVERYKNLALRTMPD